MERENGKGILFGVLGVMTLVIAVLGASLAYFTAVDRSAEDAVVVESATVTITYVQGQVLQASNLIPATQTVAETAYAKTDGQCVDSNGKQVCAVFGFSAKNGGAEDFEVIGDIITTTDLAGEQKTEFDNLSYVVYETTNGEKTKLSTEKTTLAKFGSSTTLFNNGTEHNSITVESGATNTYEILVWLNEIATQEQLEDPNNLTEGSQNHEQGLRYTGMVQIEVYGTTDKITGK